MKHSRNTLLMSVAAAALAIGMGAAFAQAPAAQQSAPAEKPQSAPAEKIAPAMEPSKGKAPDAGMKAGQAQDKTGGKAAQDMKPKATSSESKPAVTEPKATTSQTAPTASQPKATTSETKPAAKSINEMNAEGKAKAGETKPLDTAKPADAKATTTTGQGAAGTSASLSTEQRTTIRTAIQKQNVRPVTNVNFSISVGTSVPRSVRFYSVPMQLVQIYPRWRGYQYFLVGDQIVVVNPRTHQIVAVLDA